MRYLIAVLSAMSLATCNSDNTVAANPQAHSLKGPVHDETNRPAARDQRLEAKAFEGKTLLD
jgi:hypothetical protein